MKRLRNPILAAVLVSTVLVSPAAAEQRFIARTIQLPLLNGTQIIGLVCQLLGCSVRYPVDGGQTFLVTRPDLGDPLAFLNLLLTVTGIQDAEIDQVVHTAGSESGSPAVPPALLDRDPVSYYGTTVRRGYVQQPAAAIIRLSTAQSKYKLTGLDVTVAVIDTGVDPRHPVLANVLLSGYDFTRNKAGANEVADLDQSTVATLDQSTVATLDQSTVATLDQSTVATLDQSTVATLDTAKYQAFGHGTMVAGIVHLTAPQAKILPLKAFRADGSGYASDVLRAIYYAANNKAKVMNMSFDFDTSSRELERAINYAKGKGVIPVAAAGNDGLRTTVYPAALPGVIGVASTSNYDTLSAFSNYGPEVAWIAAPGEGVITTYPFKAYAAVWGTSFSAPLAAGAAALLADQRSSITPSQAQQAEGEAVWISADVKRGRLDLPKAIEAWLKVIATSPLVTLLSGL
jgi:subtilisin family serine protease